MNELEIIIDILEKSLQKNGDKPLTVSHFLNILKMARRWIDVLEEQNNDLLDSIEREDNAWK